MRSVIWHSKTDVNNINLPTESAFISSKLGNLRVLLVVFVYD